MLIPCRPLLVSSFVFFLTLAASAQDKTPAGDPRAVLTGKERLGKKWMDEQRIDNCKVPIEKRGTKQRPSICPQVPAG